MRTFFKQLYQLCKPYWGKKQNWLAWLLLTTVIGIGSGIAYINVLINDWQKGFYDTLAALEVDKIAGLMFEYFIYIAIFIVINVYRTWLRKLLVIRWRKAMTDSFIEQWLGKQVFYKLVQKNKMDNPDQRIAEDIRLFIEYSIDLLVSFAFNMIQLSLFLMTLWRLSGAPEFTLFGHTFVVEGYLVWVALIYSIVGTVITHLIGRKLHDLNYQQQVFEATFRSGLIRKQDNAEQIALYKGEETEKVSLSREFANIVTNWRKLMDKERNLGFFTVGYNRVSIILPVIFSIPLLMAKIITFGGIMQVRTAFSIVLGAFSWFISAYYTIPKWTSAVARLSQLQQEMDEITATHRTEISQSLHKIDVDDLHLFTPENNALLAKLQFEIKPQQWVHLQGESGLGKSTLLRALSGIWDFYSGTYRLSAQKSLLVPQRSYMNEGTLADVLSYPEHNIYSEQALKSVLEKVGLGAWQNRLNENLKWQNVFSGGEQQRIAFARVLLSKPDLIYLDEATSSLDEQSARTMMQLLKQELPHSTVVFISHQREVADFAEFKIDLGQYRLG